jgi:hypothetical protein
MLRARADAPQAQDARSSQWRPMNEDAVRRAAGKLNEQARRVGTAVTCGSS